MPEEGNVAKHSPGLAAFPLANLVPCGPCSPVRSPGFVSLGQQIQKWGLGGVESQCVV